MNASINKTNRGVILAAIMALVMVFAGVAVIASDNHVDAAWEMGGDIPTGDQTVAAGVDAVAISNFEITNGATWTVKSGATFTVNEGVTVTIGDSSRLVIEPGAYVEINGSLVIETGAVLENHATYSGSTSSGFFVNGTLELDKSTITTDAAETGSSALVIPTVDGTATGLTFDGANVVDTSDVGQTYTAPTVTGPSNGNVVDVTGSVPYHLNGAGNYGYWVGVNIIGITAGDYTLNLNGKNQNVTIDETGEFNIYTTAGKCATVQFIQDGKVIYGFVIDATKVTALNGQTVPGEIYVNGEMTIDSNNKTPAKINNQSIFIGVGATADINAVFTNTNVSAYAGNTNNPYTYGSVNINGTTASDLTFTAVSERISSAYIVGTETSKTTRAVNYILDIAGDVANGTEVLVKDAYADAGAYNTLQYPNDDDDGANGIQMYGIVSVNGTLNIDGTLAVQSKATVNIDGTLNIDGDKVSTTDGDLRAALDIRGQINVSGTFAIDSVTGNDQTVEPKNNAASMFNGAYLTVIGEGRITVADGALDETTLFATNVGMNAAAYENDDGLVIASLANVITSAAADNENDIYVFGNDRNGAANPYVVSADVTIADDVNLAISGRLLVSEGTTFTFADGSGVDPYESDSMLIVVEGTVMDYNLEDFTYSNTPENSLVIDAEVMYSDSEGTYNMYTTLFNALSGTPGTVVLFGDVKIDGTVTIPEGFTVDQVTNSRTITINNNSTLIVNGTIDSGDNLITVTPAVQAGEGVSAKRAGTLTVNNMIVNPNISTTVAGFTANGTIGDYENADFLLAPAVAAANAGTLYDITSQGDFSYSGTLVFTASQDNEGDTITLAGGDVNITNVTVSGFSVDITATTGFTGTVQISVTAGDSAVEFDEATGYTIGVTEDYSGEVDVTVMNLAVIAKSDGKGGVTVSAGSVTLSGTAAFGATADDVLSVAEGATLIIPRNSEISLANMAPATAGVNTDYAALSVAGTLTIEEGAVFGYAESTGINTMIQIDGNMTSAQDIALYGTVNVDGTLTIGDEATAEIYGKVNVDGTLVGATDLKANGYIIAYVGATVDTENMSIQTDGTSNASGVGVYLNGDLYLSVYALSNSNVYNSIQKGEYDLQGYEKVVFDDDSTPSKNTVWYTDETYQTELDTERAILSQTPAVYAKLNPLSANVMVSVGTGMSVYIDGVKVSNGQLIAPYNYVGNHTVEVTINPGYTGEATITFNGQPITNGTFTITPEMAGANADQVVLSVTGNITTDSTVVVDGGSGDDGLGLTDYLLIILVILIVVMAIMVAMRLMRS